MVRLSSRVLGVWLAALFSTLCMIRVARGQTLELVIDGVTAQYGQPLSGSPRPVVVLTTLTASVGVSVEQGGTTHVTCNDNPGGQIFSWSPTNSGGTTFPWTPTTIGTHSLSCTGSWSGPSFNGSATTPSIDIPVTGPTGMFSPKYLILSVQYAPPGANSMVDYTTSTNQGTTYSTKDMFSDSNEVDVTVKTPVFGDIFGIPGDNVPDIGITAAFSTTNTQEMDSSSSFSMTKMSSFDTTVKGPATNSVGLDHTQDTVTVWLNPVLSLAAPDNNTPLPLQLNNIYWDTRDGCATSTSCDGAPGMDTVTLSIAQLLDPTQISDQHTLNQLARNWAPPESDGSAPGLTADDLRAIATADPFTDPSYNPTFTDYADGTCSNASSSVPAGRFCLTSNAQIQYAGPNQGGQGDPTTTMNGYDTVAMEAKSTTDTHKIAFSLDANSTLGFLSLWSVDIKEMNTLTWEHTSGTATNKETNKVVKVTIVPPTASDNYTGPTQFAIYQDVIYGTLMFWPVPFPGWLLSATPSSGVVTAGGQTTFTVSTTAVDGGTGGTVSLSVSGLPSGASPTFSPSSVAVGNSSTLSITTTSSTPAGSYPLIVSGVIGTDLPHSVPVTLVVNPPPPPDFSISASPASQTINAGQSTTFTISTQALNGFTGNVLLSQSGVPAGVSCTFSPTSVAPGGSSTMNCSSNTSVSPGSYGIAVTGTDGGSLTHSVSPSLVLIINSVVADFALTTTPTSRNVIAGGKTTYAISMTSLAGFTGAVSLGLTGLPTGASFIFNPTSITGSGSSTLTITTTSSLAAGTYPLSVTGTSGNLAHSAAITLVALVPDFTISATPASQTISPGGSTTYTVSTTALRGFSGVVSLSRGGLPTGASGTFSPSSITGAGSSTLTITSTTAIKAGTYTITITGKSGSLTHSRTVRLVVS